jgi:hypothetical protein
MFNERESAQEILYDIEINTPLARPVKYITVFSCISCGRKSATNRNLDSCPRCNSYDLEESQASRDEVYNRKSHIMVLDDF